MRAENLFNNYDSAQNYLSGRINLNLPQKSYKEILNESQKEQLRQYKIDDFVKILKSNSGSVTSSQWSDAISELAEKRRGRPVGSYGPKRLAKEAK